MRLVLPDPREHPGRHRLRFDSHDVLAGLPPTSRELLRASYFREVSSNPGDPLRVRMRENAVDRWRPDAPIHVYHSPDDEEAPLRGGARVRGQAPGPWRRRHRQDAPGLRPRQQLDPGHAARGALLQEPVIRQDREDWTIGARFS